MPDRPLSPPRKRLCKFYHCLHYQQRRSSQQRNEDLANQTRLSQETGEVTSTSRKTNQLANNNQAKLNGQEEGRQEAVTDYIKFHYLGEAYKNAMNND